MLDVRYRDVLLVAPRQCRQHSLLVAPRLLLDLGVFELVDIHLLPVLIWVGCCGQLRKNWTRAALISSEEWSVARMFACMEMATCALASAFSCGDLVGVAAAAAAGGVGGVDSALRPGIGSV